MRKTFYTLRNIVEMVQEDTSSLSNFPNRLSNLFSQLLALPEQETKRDRMLVVIPYYDFNEKDGIECMWDVALLKPKIEKFEQEFEYFTRESLYDLLLQDWADLMDVVISPVSFEYLNEYEIVELILEEMTSFGYEYTSVRQSQLKFINDLEESIKEIDEHPERLVSYDDFCKEFEIPEETVEEKEEYKRKLEECQRKSEEKFEEYKRKHLEIIQKYRGD